MFRKALALLVSTSLLGGCYSFNGPRPVFQNGRVVTEGPQHQPRSGPLYERFRQATLRASGCAPRNATSWADMPATLVCYQDPVEQAEIDDFMQAGYDLIYADCADYFAHMGSRQRGSRLFRDAVAPIGALISGIISIVRFENSNTRDDLLAALALTTTAGTSALDIYDQNFLFNADNIDAVRRLVQDALTAHANQTFSASVNHSTFGRAASHLADNQALCTPSSILSLVREAIRSGKIVARAPSQAAAAQTTTSSTTTTAPDGTRTTSTNSSRPTPSDRVNVGVETPQ